MSLRAGLVSVAAVTMMIGGIGPVGLPSAIGAPVILGDSAIESTADGSPRGMVEANQFAATASGTVSSLSIYLDSSNAATSIGLALYSDASGVPGTLLAEGTRSSVQNGAWNSVTIAATALSSGTRYWIARLSITGGSLVTRVDPAATNPDRTDSRTVTTFPATFSPDGSWPHRTSMYAGPAPTAPSPTITPAPTASPVAGTFTCTQVMGYSQTGNWYSQQVGSAFESMVVDSRHQLRNLDGGAVWRWADPNYAGWSEAPFSPCAASSGAPDRVIFDVTESFWIDEAGTHEFDDYGGNPDISVARVAQDIRNLLTTIRDKYPSARQIYLQAVLGGPGGVVCSVPDASGAMRRIRGTWNNAKIETAIQQALNGNAVAGPHFTARTCDDFSDDTQFVGHLNTDAKGPIGRTIGAFYAARP